MSQLPSQLPASQRTAYQFPVYRWIGWLAVTGFAIGLTMMFFISGMFGIPAPLAWSALVILFTMGALLLDRPKLLLQVMMFYFLLVPGNRLFGLVSLPLLGSMNKIFFLPLIAVIVMYWIQRRQLKEATLFPLAFILVAGISWYVNGRASPIVTIQAIMVVIRFYILWYFCRLTSTFEDNRVLMRWVWGYIIYVAIQYAYNVLWQRGLWIRHHPDLSGGVFGPDSQGQAHWVGYLSVYALLLLVGWWMSSAARVGQRKRGVMILLGVIICYNLIFMTDTKHALILMPIAFLPFLFHPRFPIRARIGLVMAGLLFSLASVTYFQTATGRRDMRRYWDAFVDSPKGEMFYAVTVDFPHLVPYPIFGAGPGRFVSNKAIATRAPLARRYIIPHLDENRRRGYFLAQGSIVSASIVGNPKSELLVLLGEYGWAGAVIFYSFWFWVVYKLIRKSREASPSSPRGGIFLSLACCLIFMSMIMVLTTQLIMPPLIYPLWMLIGRMWDMPPEPHSTSPDEERDAGPKAVFG